MGWGDPRGVPFRSARFRLKPILSVLPKLDFLFFIFYFFPFLRDEQSGETFLSWSNFPLLSFEETTKTVCLFGMRINHRRRPFWRFPHKIADLLVWDRGWGWVITIRKGLPSPSIATVFRLPRYYPLTFAIPVILLSLTWASQQTASIGFGKGTEMISCNNGV